MREFYLPKFTHLNLIDGRLENEARESRYLKVESNYCDLDTFTSFIKLNQRLFGVKRHNYSCSQDPSAAALGHQHRQQGGKMASADEGARAGHFAIAEPDRGIPGHVGSEKQLHSATGYNLVVDAEGNVYGTREPYNSEAVLRFHSRAVGHVQIKGKTSNMFLAMNEKGKVYAEPDEESENTWFQEIYEDGWNLYKWLGNQKDWYLGIKKSGKMKHGHRTKRGQKAVRFVPRPSEAAHN